MSDAQDILSFWFGEPAASADELKQKVRRWFVATPELDREIIERFAADLERALAGELAGWRAEPRTRLALVVLLDQFSRTIHRGQGRAFAGDPLARELAIEAFADGEHRALSLDERMFLTMPLHHAEDLALQQQARQRFRELVADAPPDLRPIYAMAEEQSDKYNDIITRFGRFPHRNAALGRPSTPAELEFLRDWEERQHPTGMRQQVTRQVDDQKGKEP